MTSIEQSLKTVVPKQELPNRNSTDLLLSNSHLPLTSRGIYEHERKTLSISKFASSNYNVRSESIIDN